MRDLLDVHMILSLFHIVFVVPLLLFVGFQRSDTPPWVYASLLSIGAVVVAYHGARVVQRQGRSAGVWVNWIHLLVVGPLLCAVGGWGRETPRWGYELLLLLAFGAGGYHLYQLVKGLEAYPEGVKDLATLGGGRQAYLYRV
jgi:hypothetical protein